MKGNDSPWLVHIATPSSIIFSERCRIDDTGRVVMSQRTTELSVRGRREEEDVKEERQYLKTRSNRFREAIMANISDGDMNAGTAATATAR